MRTIELSLNENNDADQAVRRFEQECGRHGLVDYMATVELVNELLRDMDRRGRELASFGSQFEASKVIDLPEFKVKITATYGVRRRGAAKSFWRLLGRG